MLYLKIYSVIPFPPGPRCNLKSDGTVESDVRSAQVDVPGSARPCVQYLLVHAVSLQCVMKMKDAMRFACDKYGPTEAALEAHELRRGAARNAATDVSVVQISGSILEEKDRC